MFSNSADCIRDHQMYGQSKFALSSSLKQLVAQQQLVYLGPFRHTKKI